MIRLMLGPTVRLGFSIDATNEKIKLAFLLIDPVIVRFYLRIFKKRILARLLTRGDNF